MSNQYPYQGGGSSSTGGAGGRLPWSDIVGISSSETERQNTHDGGGSLSAGDAGSHNFWGKVADPRFQYGHQPMYPAASSMAHPDTSYYGRGFNATGSTGGQPPHHLIGAANPNYMATQQTPYSAGISMSYPGTSSYGRDFTTTVGTGEQRPYNNAAPAYTGMYRAGNTNTPLQTGMVPRSGVDPQIGYYHQHPPQPLENHTIGTHQQRPPNRPTEHPQEREGRTSWRQDESEELKAMVNSGVSWPDIARKMRRTEVMCKRHKSHLDRKDRAKALAQAKAHQVGGEGYAGPPGPAAGGAADVPLLRRTTKTRIDWSDGNLIEWAQDRARTINNTQNGSKCDRWEDAAQELNEKNGTNLSGTTLHSHFGL